MVAPASAVVIACRRVPGPESSAEVTIIGMVDSIERFSSCSRGRHRRVWWRALRGGRAWTGDDRSMRKTAGREAHGTEHGKLLQWVVFSVNLLLSQITGEVLTRDFPDAS